MLETCFRDSDDVLEMNDLNPLMRPESEVESTPRKLPVSGLDTGGSCI